MNEGKPGTPDASEGPDGDFELARPNGMRSPRTGPDGDYELGRPPSGGPARTDGASDGGATADAPAWDRPSDSDTGDESAPGAGTPARGTPTVPAPGVAGAVPASAAEAPASGVTGGAVPAPGAEAPASGVTGAVPAPAGHSTPPPAVEQPKPLHDPDPYSTPPYGEPGPWAPAPPVQHPAATPAHGVPMSALPAAPEAASGPGAPPAPAPSAPPVPHPAATPAHGVPTGAPPAVQGAVSGPGGPATAPESAPAAQDASAAGPWARYDPWAAPAAVAPLQQADPVEEDVRRRRGRRRRALVGGALAIALVSGVAGGVVGVQLERNGGIGAVELPQAGVEAPDRDPGSVAGIAAQALPSVVTLHVSGGGKAGTGTGFVLDDRGHILTNDHVVEPAGKNGDITVTFHSGDTAEATVVGRDSGYDLAVVRVKGVRGLTPLPLGNSDNVQVGDPVVAIGAPFDLAGTVTSGIISARERPITAGGENGDGSDVSYVDALQTDAPINPGNSGGPLLDGKGRVVGINSAIRSADGGLDPEGGQSGSIGLGFAIPINQGKRVAEELIEHGKAAHPVIGITLDMAYEGDGARVAAEGSDGGPPVSTGGPGAEAGIRPGDVITEVDGRPVRSGEELIVKTRAHRPGDRLELTLERNGEERTVSLVLGSSDGD
ncbi:trypsin-like peptidase domain-containing protein [Streptomyces althioticus]|uniref:trypsin-like peptidase domain-containing protein n=1 Tax=Streptomyces althioticus TaxID=83380 RepID=UPI0036C7E151